MELKLYGVVEHYRYEVWEATILNIDRWLRSPEGRRRDFRCATHTIPYLKVQSHLGSTSAVAV